MALGAFLAGMVVGRSDYSLRAASDALPMRDAFAVLFFVSVGILLDPTSLFDSPWPARRHPRHRPDRQSDRRLRDHVDARDPFRIGVMVAVALAQIGEFSFILATLGRDLGLLTHEATNTLVAASILSIVEPDVVPGHRSNREVDRAASPACAATSISRG